ncbi:hypothetical protein Bca101_005173 [Brassica carinata]
MAEDLDGYEGDEDMIQECSSPPGGISSLWLPLVAVLRTIRRWELAGSSEKIDTVIVCDKGEVDFRGDSKFAEHSCERSTHELDGLTWINALLH